MTTVLAAILLIVGAVIGFGIAALMVVAAEDREDPRRKWWEE